MKLSVQNVSYLQNLEVVLQLKSKHGMMLGNFVAILVET